VTVCALAPPAAGSQRGGVPNALRLLFWGSLAAATAAGAAHVLTYFDIPVFQTLPLVLLLVFVWPLVLWQWRRVPRRNLVSEIFGDIPRWLKVAAGVLLLFAFANFFACRALSGGTQPYRLADGRTVLLRGQEIVREVSASEFRHAQAMQVRMLTGFLVPGFALAALLLEACWIKNGPAMADEKVRGA
jgi:hypothetical protein